ncbi:hypothetical protein CYMTET_36635, partial [Cymbomonas tetramitiformis]
MYRLQPKTFLIAQAARPRNSSCRQLKRQHQVSHTSRARHTQIHDSRTRPVKQLVVAIGAKSTADTPSERTERILRELEDRQGYGQSGAGGAGGGVTLEALKRADQAWSNVRNKASRDGAGQAPQVVRVDSNRAVDGDIDVDVAVCGGTLGIFLAAALSQRGLKVAVIERGQVVGRDQEWNISRKELEELVELQ